MSTKSSQPVPPLPWLLVAVEREHLFFRRRCEILETLRRDPINAWRCRVGQRDFILAETGVGGDSVRRTLDWLRTVAPPASAIFAGFCGALVDDLRVGDAVWADAVVDGAGQTWVNDFRGFEAQGRSSLGFRRGRIITSDHLVDTGEAKRDLAAKSGAIVVEMESSYFAEWCRVHEVPWGCLRVVSDDARTNVSKDVFDLLEGGRVSPWRLMRGIVRRPSLIGDLLHLRKATNHAASVIDAAFAEIMAQPRR